MSTGQSVLVAFETDRSVRDGRFALSWTFVDQGGSGTFSLYWESTFSVDQQRTIAPFALFEFISELEAGFQYAPLRTASCTNGSLLANKQIWFGGAFDLRRDAREFDSRQLRLMLCG